jgi:hypothetical protein
MRIANLQKAQTRFSLGQTKHVGYVKTPDQRESLCIIIKHFIFVLNGASHICVCYFI